MCPRHILLVIALRTHTHLVPDSLQKSSAAHVTVSIEEDVIPCQRFPGHVIHKLAEQLDKLNLAKCLFMSIKPTGANIFDMQQARDLQRVLDPFSIIRVYNNGHFHGLT